MNRTVEIAKRAIDIAAGSAGLLVTAQLFPFTETLTNPFQLEEADGALADDMRMKMLYDLAYVAKLERLTTFLSIELEVHPQDSARDAAGIRAVRS